MAARECVDSSLARMRRDVTGQIDDRRDASDEIDDALRTLPEFRRTGGGADRNKPFVIRDFAGFARDRIGFERELAREPEVYGYDSSPIDNSEVEALTLPGAEALRRYRARSLNFNIVDSECSHPAALLAEWPASGLPVPPSLSWILTLAPARTFFHCDPPYGDCFMYLCEGHKVWLFIAPEDIAEIERRHGFEIVNRLPLAQLMALDDGFLRGRILIGEIRGGDFIYFPQGWAHYVRTLHDSFGYGGYFGSDAETGGPLNGIV